MTAPSPLLRSLQVLAAVLGLAVLVLFALWLRMEPRDEPIARTDERRVGDDAPADAVAGDVSGANTAEARLQRPSITAREAAAANSSAAVLYGTVRSGGGALIEDGVFWLYEHDRHVGTQSLRDGTFAFAGLRPGLHRLRSRIPDELPLDREIQVVGPTTRVDIELTRRWQLTVNALTPSGEPLLEQVRTDAPRSMRRGITAAGFAEPLAGDLPLSNRAEVTAGLGTFRAQDPWTRPGEKALPKETVGILTLPADAPVHVALLMRNHVVAQQRALPGQETVTFTIGKDEFLRHTATVRVRLVDAGGAPVTNARVALNDAQTGGGGTEVGDDGRVTLRHLKPGRLDLEVSARDLCAPRVQVDVAAGADLDLGDIVMRQGITAEIVMDNFEGRGSVRFQWLGTPPPGMTCDEGYVSNQSLKIYRLRLYPGRYGMLASAANGVAILEVDLDGPAPAPIRFDLRPGAPLTIENRVGAGFARMELRSASGVLIRRRELTGTSVEVVKLPAGGYVATITDRTGAVTRRELRLTSAGATLTIP